MSVGQLFFDGKARKCIFTSSEKHVEDFLRRHIRLETVTRIVLVESVTETRTQQSLPVNTADYVVV